MKKNIIYFVVGILILFIGCSNQIEKNLSANLVQPILKFRPKLFYPIEAQEKSINGTTKASLYINKKGSVVKVVILKSAGSPILDKAAEEYCSQLVFNPATVDGKAIDSKVIWEVKFNFANNVYSTNEYLDEIGQLYELANRAVSNERMSILQKALEKHIQYINNNTDALNFNYVISKMIKRDIVDEWKDYWNSYPLTFLVYYDFMERFSNYDSSKQVKKLMLNSLKNDLQYIQANKNNNEAQKHSQEIIIQKIKTFLSDKYSGDSVLYKSEPLMLVKTGKICDSNGY